MKEIKKMKRKLRYGKKEHSINIPSKIIKKLDLKTSDILSFEILEDGTITLKKEDI